MIFFNCFKCGKQKSIHLFPPSAKKLTEGRRRCLACVKEHNRIARFTRFDGTIAEGRSEPTLGSLYIPTRRGYFNRFAR